MTSPRAPLPADALDDHLELIARILPYQDRDSLLRLSVVLCDQELAGNGCSLFLSQPEQHDLELRESTVLTRFLGQRLHLDFEKGRRKAESLRSALAKIDVKPEDLNRTLTFREVKGWRTPEVQERILGFGLTSWAVHFNCPLVVERIEEDLRWSGYQQTTSSPVGPSLRHCELTRAEIGSAVFAPWGERSEPLPRGMLRLVRRRDRPGLGDRELGWMVRFASHLERHLQFAITLADLMDLGAKLEFEHLGKSLVDLLKKRFRAKGCSIFLELKPNADKVKTFQCVATTGLYLRTGAPGEATPISKEDAKYLVDLGQNESDSLTGWVLRKGQLIDLESSVEFDPETLPSLNRPRVEGTFSESGPDDLTSGGPILISPLFRHQGGDVVGAIRMVRPRKEGESFQLHEKLIFLDISRQLSKVLTNLHLRQVSEELFKLYNDPHEMLRRVPLEVCHLLEVKGCSVLRLERDQKLRLVATRGLLEGQENEIIYDLKGDGRGWTAWVARRKRPLLFNEPGDENKVDPNDPPIHSPHDPSPRKHGNKCEIGQDAHRFLAVPIFEQPEDQTSKVVGVIRVPRSSKEPRFEEADLSILASFAARLSLALNVAARNESLRAVAELAAMPAGSGEPAQIVETVLDRAQNVLAETLELPEAQIHLDFQRNPKPQRGMPPDGFVDREIRMGRLQLGVIRHRLEPELTESQRNLLDLLAGVCANAKYSQEVYNKLDTIRRGLVEVGQTMTSERTLAARLGTIAQVAADVTWADNVVIHEYLAPPSGQPVTDGVFRESAWGGRLEPRVWKETNFKPDAVPFEVVKYAVTEFAPVARRSTVLYHQKEGQNFIDREGIESAAALALQVKVEKVDICVGCIFFNYKIAQSFPEQSKQEIRMMAEYAAIAIYQGRLLEETKQLVREKSNLLRFADHSLKQPLSAIQGFLDNLADGFLFDLLAAGDLTDPARFSASRLARQAAQRQKLCEYVGYLVDSFLRVDRMELDRRREGGGLQGAPPPTLSSQLNIEENGDLSDVCEQVVGVAEAYEGNANRIERSIPPGIHCRMNRHAVSLAILNILVNAVKFTRGQKPPRISLSLRVEGGWAEILVDDSGPGIPDAKERVQIFELYYSKAGLGIGLYLSRSNIAAHGGEISVDERPSPLSGARFIVRLPGAFDV